MRWSVHTKVALPHSHGRLLMIFSFLFYFPISIWWFIYQFQSKIVHFQEQQHVPPFESRPRRWQSLHMCLQELLRKVIKVTHCYYHPNIQVWDFEVAEGAREQSPQEGEERRNRRLGGLKYEVHSRIQPWPKDNENFQVSLWVSRVRTRVREKATLEGAFPKAHR